MFVRTAALRRDEYGSSRQISWDIAAALVATLPYTSLRGVAWLRGDAISTHYLHSHLLAAAEVPIARLAAGLWSAYRAAWIFIIAAIWLVPREIGRAKGACFALIVLGSALSAVLIAADMSRSLMMISPVLLLGVWLSAALPRRWPRYMLPAVVAANLLLPSSHEMWHSSVPIARLPTELSRLFAPAPPILQAADLLDEAARLVRQGNLAAAQDKLDGAIRLDSANAMAFARRTALRIQNRQLSGDLGGSRHGSPNRCRNAVCPLSAWASACERR